MNTRSQESRTSRPLLRALTLLLLFVSAYASTHLDASLPNRDVAREGRRGDSPGRHLPVPSASDALHVEGPADQTVECDGAGNLEERDAWLAEFTSSSTCGAVSSHLATHEGRLAGQRSLGMCDLSMFQLNGSCQTLSNPTMSGEHCALHLTDGTAQAGSAFLQEPVSLAGSASFSAYFTFRISKDYYCAPLDVDAADGLVFVVAGDPTSLGETGGQLGYGGIERSLGIEFDTYDNGGMDGNMKNQAGINVSGRVDGVPRVHMAEPFNNQDVWFAWVDFDGLSHGIEVRLASTAERPAAPQMATHLDLVDELGTTDAYFGFSSGTGCAGGSHEILSLDLATILPQDESACGSSYETVIYTAGDDCGNSGAEMGVFHIADTVGPALTAGLLDDCYGTAEAAEEAALAATAVDDACSDVTHLAAAASGNCDAVVWVRAVDECGNVSRIAYETRINDGLPVLIGVPPNEDASCNRLPGPPDVIALSPCGDTEDVEFAERLIPGDHVGSYTLERTWTTTDLCGNSARATQTLTVSDSEAPRLSAQLVPLDEALLPIHPLGADGPCSAPDTRHFEVACSAEDACDASPLVSAKLVARRSVPARRGSQPTVSLDVQDVTCGDIIELQLIPEPHQGRRPHRPRAAFGPNSEGLLSGRAQAFVLRVHAEDASGNESTVTVGPNDARLCEAIRAAAPCRKR